MISIKRYRIIAGTIIIIYIVGNVIITPNKSAYINGEIISDIGYIISNILIYKLLKNKGVVA